MNGLQSTVSTKFMFFSLDTPFLVQTPGGMAKPSHAFLTFCQSPLSLCICMLLCSLVPEISINPHQESVESELLGCKILAFPPKTMSIHAGKTTVNVK